MMGVALILALRFHRHTAWMLLVLFTIQFAVTSKHGRLILCGVYAAVAVVALIVNRGHLLATLHAPFQRLESLEGEPMDPSKLALTRS
jgi:cation:H+ antiporter